MAILNMNTELFEQNVTEGEKPVLVEYWAPWCVYCRRIAPAFNKIAEQYEGRVVIGQVNIDDMPGLADENKIEVVPTMVFYKNGVESGSIVAPDSKAKIEAFIEENLG